MSLWHPARESIRNRSFHQRSIRITGSIIGPGPFFVVEELQKLLQAVPLSVYLDTAFRRITKLVFLALDATVASKRIHQGEIAIPQDGSHVVNDNQYAFVLHDALGFIQV